MFERVLLSQDRRGTLYTLLLLCHGMILVVRRHRIRYWGRLLRSEWMSHAALAYKETGRVVIKRTGWSRSSRVELGCVA